jgi:hypothetical protein
LPDHANRRTVLILEFNALVAQQGRTMKDEAFGGWGVEEKAAYEERARRTSALRAELFPLDRSEPRAI